jgi:threonine synthase
MRQICLACGRVQPEGFHPFCGCGGMVDVEYDLRRVELADSGNPYIRFADLLPVRALRGRLPADAVYTPVIRATRLGQRLGMPALFLKDESRLPTRTTKDRMAAVSLAYLADCGVRTFCASSTGNSSTAYALAIRAHPGMHAHIFTAEDFAPRVQHADHDQVTHHILRGASFVEAFQCAVAHAAKHGLVSERGFFNPGRREGLKLAFLEAAEQIAAPIDWYVQAVSSAMGVWGCTKGAKELRGLGRIDRLPKLLCVQQESCSPMASAFAEGSPAILPRHLVERPRGIAEAILRGDPTRVYPYVRAMVLESGGGFAAVSEPEIREARQMLEDCEGISPCFSASAALAGLVKRVRSGDFPSQETVLVNLTGGDRKPSPPGGDPIWLRRDGADWLPESE